MSHTEVQCLIVLTELLVHIVGLLDVKFTVIVAKFWGKKFSLKWMDKPFSWNKRDPL